MGVSYFLKRGKNVFLLTTGHTDPDICPGNHKKNKPVIMDFYNF